MSEKRPSIEILTEPPPADADARITYGPEPLQFGDLRLPLGDGPHPLVIFIHGGYWQAIYNLTHAGHLCIDLAARGIATWNVEYRRVGDVGGGWPTTLEDVVQAVAHVRKLAGDYPLDLGRVVLVGHSAGGHLALLASIRTDVSLRAVVSIAGVVHLPLLAASGADKGLIARFLGGSREEVPDVWREASPHEHLPWRVPTVLACGTADAQQLGPNEATVELARVAGGDLEWLPLPEAGHFEPVDPQARQWAMIRARIETLLA